MTGSKKTLVAKHTASIHTQTSMRGFLRHTIQLTTPAAKTATVRAGPDATIPLPRCGAKYTHGVARFDMALLG
jgi:hypothetical protein